MHPLYDQLHARIARSGLICVGTCRQSANGDKSTSRDHLVPDSGATSDMFNQAKYFGYNYKKLTKSYVYMGDGSPIPAIGIGTVTFKANSHHVQLPNALHVPNLECIILSITRYGLRGEGCSYLAEKGTIHVSFPTFTISKAIPLNWDLKFRISAVDNAENSMCAYNGHTPVNPLAHTSGREQFV